MKISDRLLRQYLDHVYWICGGPCGGKSTMTNLLSSKWDMNYYSSDDHTFDYQKRLIHRIIQQFCDTSLIGNGSF